MFCILPNKDSVVVKGLTGRDSWRGTRIGDGTIRSLGFGEACLVVTARDFCLGMVDCKCEECLTTKFTIIFETNVVVDFSGCLDSQDGIGSDNRPTRLIAKCCAGGGSRRVLSEVLAKFLFRMILQLFISYI